LEAIARHRAKTHDVLVALGASLHHGVLYAVLRKISSNFLGSDDYSAEFVESFLSLVGVMMSSTTNGNTMIASGIIPLLLSFLSGPTHRGKLIGKAVTIIDNACYSFHALPNVVEAGGLSTIVHRIKVEVTQVIGNASTPIHIEQATLIKSMLKFILHLLQAFGSADGLRNLIDTHLPATIAQVFENPSAFGNSITAYCIHILAAFVHQEPTSLATLQEQGLTDKFLAMSLEPIPPSSEYIAALPNGFGACCLNGVGLDKVMTANPFKNLFSVLYSETYRRILYENDTASNIGNAVDELMRHQPKLKDLLIAEILHAVESLWTLNKGESAQDVLLLSASNAVNERIEVVVRACPCSLPDMCDSFWKACRATCMHATSCPAVDWTSCSTFTRILDYRTTLLPRRRPCP
jgi:E3 ubiquitin-protein ligase HUWE1